MSVSVALPSTNDINPLRLDNSFCDANGQSNMAPMTQLANPPAAEISMMGQSLDPQFDDSTNPIPGDDTASASTTSSPTNFFKQSPASSVSNYSVSPNDLEDVKPVIADEAFQTAIDPADTNAAVSRPRTRRSTGSMAKQRQTETQTQAQQPQTQKRKQQQQTAATPAAKSKKTTKSSNKSGAGARKSKPRSRSLERNRIAASKCRQKKKEWLSDLEANKSRLERQYKALHGECSELMDEVSRLKNFVMAHAGCNDPNIDGWINNEANSYIRKLSQNIQPQAGAGMPAQGNQGAMKNMDSLTSPDSQANNMISPPDSNGYSQEYMLDGMFDTDPLLGQPMAVN